MRKTFKVLGFMVLLMLLQQALECLGNGALQAQKHLIEEKDLEPAVFFYTESEQALSSEKVMRKKVSEPPVASE